MKVTWYDGTSRPPAEVMDLIEKDPPARSSVPGQGNIFVGTEGVLLHPHGGTPRLFARAKFKDFRYPKLEPRDHYKDFVDCCLKGAEKPSANFDYSGPLTEAVLLGCLASIFPNQTLEWDAPALRVANSTRKPPPASNAPTALAGRLRDAIVLLIQEQPLFPGELIPGDWPLGTGDGDTNARIGPTQRNRNEKQEVLPGNRAERGKPRRASVPSGHSLGGERRFLEERPCPASEWALPHSLYVCCQAANKSSSKTCCLQRGTKRMCRRRPRWEVSASSLTAACVRRPPDSAMPVGRWLVRRDRLEARMCLARSRTNTYGRRSWAAKRLSCVRAG